MQITLKNVKHVEWNSQETNCFTATVYVDGKRAFLVSNEGHGGCDDHQPLKGQSREEFREILGKAKAFAEKHTFTLGSTTLNHNLDTWIGDLFEEHLAAKQLKNLLKSKLIYRKADDGSIRGLAISKAYPTIAHAIHALRKAKFWNEDNTLLNTLPFDEALKIFRAA